MKRSGFLRSLASLIAAPSVLAGIEGTKEPILKSKSLIPPVTYLDERVGDIVCFKNGQKAMITSIIMGKPTFRNLKNESLLDTSTYKLVKNVSTNRE